MPDTTSTLAPTRDTWRGATVLAALILAFLSTPIARYGESYYSPADISQNFRLMRVEGSYSSGNQLLSDVFVQMEPWVLFNRDELRAGRIPLWNPYNGGGEPHLANYQSAVFSPFSLPFYVLPLRAALLVAAFAKLFALAFFTFLFLQELRLSLWPAVLGATAFTFCGHNVFLLGYPHPAAGVALPAGLFFAERFVRRASQGAPGSRAALFGFGASLLVGLLAGQPEPYYFAVLAVAIYCAARLFGVWVAARRQTRGAHDRAEARGVLALGAPLLITALLAAGLGAFQLLPFLEYLGLSRLYEQRGGVQTPLIPRLWPLAFYPDLLGNPSTPYYVHHDLPPPNYETANTTYVGGLALLLATLSLAFVRRRAVHAFFVAVAVVWVLFAYDVAGFAQLVAHIPSLERAPINRSQALWAFTVAVCAAFGLQGLLNVDAARGTRTGARLGRSLVVLAATAGLLFVSIRGAHSLIDLARHYLGQLPGKVGFDMEGFHREGPHHIRAMAPLFAAGGVALAAIVLLRNSIVRGVLAALVIALVFAQSGWLFRNYNPVSEDRFVFPRTPGIERLTSYLSGEPFLSLGTDSMPPEANLPYRLRMISAYDGLWVRDYDRLYRDMLGDESNWRPARRLSRKALQLFGVRYVYGQGPWLPTDTVFEFAAHNPRLMYETPVHAGADVVQTFTATEDELQAIAVRVGTQRGKARGILELRLEDPQAGKVLAESSIDCAGLGPESILYLHYFVFEPIADSRDRAFRLRLSSPDGVIGTAPAVWCRRDWRDWQNQALWRARRARGPVDDALVDTEHPDLGKWNATKGGEPIEGGVWFDMSYSFGDYERVASIAGWGLYRSQRSFARFHTVTRASVAATLDDAWAILHHPAFNPERDVVLTGIDPALVDEDAPTGGSGNVEVLEEAPGSIRLRVKRDLPGWLVLSQAWYPGWKARVDGVERPLIRANYAFAAVAVDAGESVVELDYEPASFRRGLAISAVSLVLAAFFFLRQWRGLRGAPSV